MYKIVSLVIIIMSVIVTASAQTKQKLNRSLEAREIALKAERSAINSVDKDTSYVGEVSYSYPADEFKPGVVQVGPRTTYLKEGFSVEEVKRLLGTPSAISERTENSVVVTTYEFPRAEGRVLIAEFKNGLLVRSTMESRAQVVRVDR
jgi:hypothetical protein